MNTLIRHGHRADRAKIRDDMTRKLFRETCRLIRMRHAHGTRDAAILNHYDTLIEERCQLLERLTHA
ncbi:hypothetical protein AAIA72_16130 [Hahella sp. SMD15-11]|uniref:Uncharacterized protein n=1 Tax=Thermohahella caldifontis TaxID=3142973 RepID=A0AB39UWJ4_9GAMM